MDRSALWMMLCLEAAGCSTVEPPGDSPYRFTPTDPDIGELTVSTSSPVDSGTWTPDTGQTSLDSGTSDSGTLTDSGTTPTDTGTTPPDTGTFDTGTTCSPTLAEISQTCFGHYVGTIYYEAGPCPDGNGCWACCGGRPLRFGEVHRPRVDALPRSPIARFWAEQAADERASVHAFLRAVTELEALGAPTALIEAHRRAALDEMDHAERCLAIASMLAGSPVRLAPWDPPDLPLCATLAELARAVFLEGCLNETVAAGIAHEQARRATDPRIRAHLRRIADDESRHAALAWRTVRWALEVGGPEVREALGDLAAGVPHVASAPDASREGVGWLGPQASARAARDVIERVVKPCCEALAARAQQQAQPNPHSSG